MFKVQALCLKIFLAKLFGWLSSSQDLKHSEMLIQHSPRQRWVKSCELSLSECRTGIALSQVLFSVSNTQNLMPSIQFTHTKLVDTAHYYTE